MRVADADREPGPRDVEPSSRHHRLARRDARTARGRPRSRRRRACRSRTPPRVPIGTVSPSASVEQPVLDEEVGEHPDAVAAHLGGAPVGVVVVHEPLGGRILGEGRGPVRRGSPTAPRGSRRRRRPRSAGRPGALSCAPSSSIAPSGSANSTKSLPVPWPLVNRSSVLTRSAYPAVARACCTRSAAPASIQSRVAVAAEPAHLPARVAAGERRGLLHRLLLVELAAQLRDRLRVADRPARGHAEPGRAAAPRPRRAARRATSRARARRAARPARRGRCAGRSSRCRRHSSVSDGQPGAERRPGELDHLEGADQPPAVGGADRVGRRRIHVAQPPVQHARARSPRARLRAARGPPASVPGNR